MKLIDYYRTYLDIELEKQKPGCKILTSAFILKSIYMAVIENTQTGRVYLIADNMKNSPQICIDLQVFKNPGGYICFNLYRLKERLPERVYNYLLDNGLFMTPKEGRCAGAVCAVHRLVYCISCNIAGQTIDHIDRNPKNNAYNNLFPVSAVKNAELKSYRAETHSLSIKIEKRIQENRKQKKRARQTLQTADILHLKILKYSLTHTPAETIKAFSQKIKTPQRIRDIINLYRRADKFLGYYENLNIQAGCKLPRLY